MIAQIPLEALGLGSGWALVSLFVVLIYRGAIIPRRIYDDALHDRDTWRAAQMVSEAGRAKHEEQLRELSESARVVNQIMREVQDRLQSARTGGEGP